MIEPRDRDMVLVVDDDPTLRLLARETLEQAGFAVEGVEDGDSILTVCARVNPVIVLLDVHLPGRDGFAVCATLRNQPESAPIPVLMMTALDDADSIHRAFEAGATDFITKPLNWTLLPHRLRYLLRASRALDALRVSQARLDQAQQVARLGNWELDLPSGAWHWSEEMSRLLNLTPGSAAPSLQALRQPVDPEDRIRLEAAFAAARDHGRPYGDDYRLRLPDGRVRFVHERIEVVADSNGQPLRIIGTVQDITERKGLEAQLAQSQKVEALGLLAGGIAHDFNNLLTVMLGYAELAARQVGDDSMPGRHLQAILAAGTHARDLVKQVLTFSRRTPPVRKPMRLHGLVTEVLTFLRASFPSTIEIRHHLDAAAGTVLADPTQIHQILINLGANAEHAMRESGGVFEARLDAVEVDAAFAAQRDLQPGPYVRLTVRDSGRGMTSEVMERIFDPFFTTKPTGEGTGIGLAVTQGIVVSHGGVITVTSAPGRGTAFEVYLPQVDTPEEEDAPCAAVVEGGTRRILLVDDEVAAADVAQDMLQTLGHTVTACTNPLEALEVFRAAPSAFDLVITDQTMPSITGDQLALELRRIEPDIPIILCTGYSHTVSAEQAQAIGVNAYLLKPLLTVDYDRAIVQVLGAPLSKNPRGHIPSLRLQTPALGGATRVDGGPDSTRVSSLR